MAEAEVPSMNSDVELQPKSPFDGLNEDPEVIYLLSIVLSIAFSEGESSNCSTSRKKESDTKTIESMKRINPQLFIHSTLPSFSVLIILLISSFIK